MDSTALTVDGRTSTFKKQGWPHARTGTKYQATPTALAKAGFYCRPLQGSDDNVCCFMCGKNLDGWEPQDEAWSEHVRHAPNCPLVRLDLQASRIATFLQNHLWPHTQALSAQNMADAGFFYWPHLAPSKGRTADDTAICFQCGLALDGWAESDDPREEHSRRRPECPFIVSALAKHPCAYEYLLACKPLPAIAPAVSKTGKKDFKMPNLIPPTKVARKAPTKTRLSIALNEEDFRDADPKPQKPSITIPPELAELISSDQIDLTLSELIDELIARKLAAFDRQSSHLVLNFESVIAGSHSMLG